MKDIIIQNKIEVQVVPFSDTKKIYIKVYYIPNTEFNPLKDKIIIFYIEIKHNYPLSNPIITCNSNVFIYFIYQFTYPSLFDNRNYYIKQSNDDLTLKDIIRQFIPDLFKEYLKNVEKKIFNFIGNYIIKHIYNINDFLENTGNFFFKVIILNQLYYSILTEVCILLFKPYKSLRGKLIFVKELRNVIFSELINPNDESNFKLEIKFNDNNGLIIYFSQKEKIELFNTIVQERRNLIYNKMKKFKIIEFEETIEIIIAFIDYKEKELNEKKEQKQNLLNELIILYQKAIETFSNDNDKRYDIYLTKFKNLLSSQK